MAQLGERPLWNPPRRRLSRRYGGLTGRVERPGGIEETGGGSDIRKR